MNTEQAKEVLSKAVLSPKEAFEVLQLISRLCIDPSNESTARELLLRCVEKQHAFTSDLKVALREHIANQGYYPYLKDFPLSPRAAIGLEFHRSESMPDTIMHSEQFEIAQRLLSNQSTILSAPTSFGKSLLIEEIVASQKHKNIVIIEPTLALVDEVRQKMLKYETRYRLIFSTAQLAHPENNLFVLTPERVVEFPQLPKIDFFVIDEFYKLSPNRQDERSAVLNHSFYLLLQHTRNFYLLGPRIASIPANFAQEFKCSFLRTNFATVVNELQVKKAPKKFEERFPVVRELLSTLKNPTLIYCPSPEKAEKFSIELSHSSDWLTPTSAHDEAISWIETNIHNKWSFIECLKRGVAFHHGRLPRYLAKYLVRAFNEGSIHFLVCTSTLMEGVNTSAKNVVIYEAKRGNKKLDHFDFANISGRSGRMGRYVTGNVFSFDPPPPNADIEVDFPWFTQHAALDEVLVQLQPIDLTPSSQERVKPYYESPLLSITTIRKNSNIPPAAQLALAAHINANIEFYHSDLRWTGKPTWTQLRLACDLIWGFLIKSKQRNAGVSSGPSLAFVISRYERLKTPSSIIKEILQKENKPIDEAVRECMEQIRVWCEFKFPKLLLALESIQQEVLAKNQLPAGNYRFYATSIEHSFLPPAFAALREMGVPAQLARKIKDSMGGDPSVEEVVQHIRVLMRTGRMFDNFERRLLLDV